MPEPKMTVAQFAARLIPCFEGFRAKAYKDSGGIWTIGYGHTQGVREGDTCTFAQAVQWLEADIAPLVKAVEGAPFFEAVALVDFGFNCGIGNLRKLLAGLLRLDECIHDHAGNVLPGLVARRSLEAALMELANA